MRTVLFILTGIVMVVVFISIVFCIMAPFLFL